MEHPTSEALGLTDREVVIVWAWATGHGTEWIAEWTGRGIEAVQTDVKRLLQKLGAANRTHATAIVMRAIAWERPASVVHAVASPSALKAVRLADIPLDQRMRAARLAVKTCADAKEASDLLWAALFPSEKTYWVREAAVEERAAA